MTCDIYGISSVFPPPPRWHRSTRDAHLAVDTHLAEEVGTARNADRGTTIAVPDEVAGRDGVAHVTIVLLRGSLLGEHYSRATVQRLRERLSYKTRMRGLTRGPPSGSDAFVEMQMFSRPQRRSKIVAGRRPRAFARQSENSLRVIASANRSCVTEERCN